MRTESESWTLTTNDWQGESKGVGRDERRTSARAHRTNADRLTGHTRTGTAAHLLVERLEGDVPRHEEMRMNGKKDGKGGWVREGGEAWRATPSSNVESEVVNLGPQADDPQHHPTPLPNHPYDV